MDCEQIPAAIPVHIQRPLLDRCESREMLPKYLRCPENRINNPADQEKICGGALRYVARPQGGSADNPIAAMAAGLTCGVLSGAISNSYLPSRGPLVTDFI